MTERWEAVIGLEVHAQLLTETKLFCACATRFGEEPNQNVCPVCLGLPGALPVLNRHAVELAVRAATALGCTVHEESVFARKNYFYPDLPKGYQISQYERPLATAGALELELESGKKRAGITRVHMEEDAGKNVHGVGGDSLVDLNRAGTPLIEIVGEPDLRGAAEAAAYLRALRDVLVYLGVNDGNLEEGSFRCDANVSVRRAGDTALGTRTEIKNVNSFRFVQRAIELEVARQIAVLESGGKLVQETRGFDHEDNRTYSLRSKEEAHDYRYFPDPDLPPLRVHGELRSSALSDMPELPAEKRQRYEKLGLSGQAAHTLTAHPGIARFFEDTLSRYPNAVRAANFIQTEVLKGAKVHGLEARFDVSPAQLAELLTLSDAGKISGKQAKEVFQAMAGTDASPAAIVEQRGLAVVADEALLLPILERLLAENPKQVEQVRAGKKGMLGFFVGQVMKATGGAADPRLVNQLLERLISGEALMPIPHPEPLSGASYSAVELTPDDAAVLMLDQRLLPNEERYERMTRSSEVARGIRDMVVRGAPAIGIAAAYGVVLGAREAKSLDELRALAGEIRRARPTAVNLMWAVDRMLASAERCRDVAALAAEARSIHADDVRANRRMGELGEPRIPDGATIVTHCNAGALATGGYGTALGVIRAAVQAGKKVRVLADETRPYLQGLRLTAWELSQDGIPVELLTDGMAGWLLSKGQIDLGVVGSDRIARNGDVANKIGTYSLACLARLHDRAFYVAAPWSTVDVACPSGSEIPIEERSPTEVTHFGERRIAPEGVGARNPAFDVTPARLVSAIFTERGVIEPVGEAAVLALEAHRS